MTKFVKDLNRKPELVKAGRGGKTVNTFICFGKF